MNLLPKIQSVDSPGEKIPFALSWVLLLLVTGSTAVFSAKVFFSILHSTALDHVAGAWTCLAVDLNNGVFYRPLFSEETGFGGTRYFPLFFSLHALIIHFTEMPIIAGHILNLVSGAILIAACLMFLRQIGHEWIVALVFSSCLLATASIQFGLESIRGDMLPLALNIWGFVMYSSKLPRKPKEILTAAFFVFAFSAKITAIHGIASLSLWLLNTGRRRDAFRMFALTAFGCLCFLAVLHLTTSGRALAIFQACSTGGTTFYHVLKSPVSFFERTIKSDPITALILFWALLILCRRWKILYSTLPGTFFGFSLLITIFIFGSPGISYNHLVDIATASILLIGCSLSIKKSGNIRSSIYTYMIVIIFSVSFNLPIMKDNITQRRVSIPAYPEKIIEYVKQKTGNVISEDPLISVMADKTPYIIDPFMLRLLIANNEMIKASIFDAIRLKKIEAVIFQSDPISDRVRYSNLHFGAAFVEKIIENYQINFRCGRYVAYVPK